MNRVGAGECGVRTVNVDRGRTNKYPFFYLRICGLLELPAPPSGMPVAAPPRTPTGIPRGAPAPERPSQQTRRVNKGRVSKGRVL